MTSRALLLAALAAALAAPAADARPAPPNPTQMCTTLRTGLGATLFNKAYGTRAPFASCVTRTAIALSAATSASVAACRAEQTDPNDTIAFARCVQAKVDAAASALALARLEAARRCAAEQRAAPRAFAARYKTFAACFSAKLRR